MQNSNIDEESTSERRTKNSEFGIGLECFRTNGQGSNKHNHSKKQYHEKDFQDSDQSYLLHVTISVLD
jgi:hypothetical protein